MAWLRCFWGCVKDRYAFAVTILNGRGFSEPLGCPPSGEGRSGSIVRTPADGGGIQRRE